MARKKRKSYRALLVVLSLIVCSVLGLYAYRTWVSFRASTVKYPGFDIVIPQNYAIHGIDVSRYQQIIAWEEVSEMQVREIRLGFAFIKATEGISNVDVQFKRNWKRAKKAGMVRGAYHFFLATRDGKLQAQHFIKQVDLEPGDLPPVLDVEQSYGVSTAVLRKEVKEWLDVVEAYYGVRPILYTNADFYKQKLGSQFDDYPLWVAHYYQPAKPRIARDWIFWQHSEEGRVNGILSRVDFNVFNGDSTDFRELLVD